VEDFCARTRLAKDERRVLAKIGALNQLGEQRRTALWQVEGLLAEDDLLAGARSEISPPLPAMNPVERLQADYEGTGLTIGPHAMHFLRPELPHVTCASDLPRRKDGQKVAIAGVVICRQRPGTAKGHVFISVEDETGVANAIVRSELFEKLRLTITHEPFLEIHGRLQKQEGVITLIAQDIRGLNSPGIHNTQSHDFR
jgi:error-prone DNA polymerase